MLTKDVNDGEAKAAMEAAARRVLTLAQVYEHLLGTGMTRTTNFVSFVLALCDSLRTINKNEGLVAFDCKLDPLVLDLDAVTALGRRISPRLSPTALSTPSPDAPDLSDLPAPARIMLRLLTISDNGVGFDKNAASTRNGLRLIKRLVEQICGSFEIMSNAGTTWTIRFRTTTPAEV